MRRSRLAMATLAVIAMLGPPPAATAAPVSYYFSGTFEQLFGLAPAALNGSGVDGMFVYDPSAAVDLATANSLTYAAGSADLTIDTVVGTGGFDPGSGRIRSRWDDVVPTVLSGTFGPADTFEAGGTASFGPPLSVFNVMNLQFIDGTGGAPDDPFGAPLSPPPMVLSLADLDAAELHLVGAGVVNGVFQTIASATATVTCLGTDPAACRAVTPVPEPDALTLVGLAVIAGFVTRRRKSARTST